MMAGADIMHVSHSKAISLLITMKLIKLLNVNSCKEIVIKEDTKSSTKPKHWDMFFWGN